MTTIRTLIARFREALNRTAPVKWVLPAYVAIGALGIIAYGSLQDDAEYAEALAVYEGGAVERQVCLTAAIARADIRAAFESNYVIMEAELDAVGAELVADLRAALDQSLPALDASDCGPEPVRPTR